MGQVDLPPTLPLGSPLPDKFGIHLVGQARPADVLAPLSCPFHPRQHQVSVDLLPGEVLIPDRISNQGSWDYWSFDPFWWCPVCRLSRTLGAQIRVERHTIGSRLCVESHCYGNSNFGHP
jgi:hypothetical protein